MSSEPLSRHPGNGWTLADPYPMRRSTLRAFHALIVALCPLDAGLDAPALGTTIRRTMRYMHPVMAWLFCVAVHLLDWAPIWRLRAVRRLHRLERERAAALLQSIGESRVSAFRTLVMGTRAAVLSSYFDQSGVHARLGYDPVPFMRGRVALRQRLVAGGRATAADRIGRDTGGTP